MDNRINLTAYRCTYWEGKLYCIAGDFNLLFSIDTKDGTVELIDTVPQTNLLSPFSRGHIVIHNNKLIIPPDKSGKIWIYNLLSKRWSNIPVEKRNTLYGSGVFFQAYIYDNNLFLIGGDYPAILCLNPENQTCDYIEEPYQDITDRHHDIDFSYFRLQGVSLKNTLYLASCLDNYVLKFDMQTKKHQWIKVGDDSYVYSEITWDGNNFWLSPRINSDIVKWDGKDKTKILPMPDKLRSCLNLYTWTAGCDGDHVIFPCISHPKSIIIDTQKDTFEFLEQQYILYTRLDNGMVISQTKEGELSIKTDSTTQTYNPSIDIKQLNHFYEKHNLSVFEGGTMYQEAPAPSLLSLKNYLDSINPAAQRKPKTERQVGKTIWETIK